MKNTQIYEIETYVKSMVSVQITSDGENSLGFIPRTPYVKKDNHATNKRTYVDASALPL